MHSMDGSRRDPSRPFVLWTAAICLQGVRKPGVANVPDQFRSAAAIEVFNAGFAYIQDIYINTADIGELVLIGLNGLRRIEPALATVKSDASDEVALLIDGRAAAQTKLASSAAEWASAAVHLIESGRTASAALNAATAESIYASIFDTIWQINGFLYPIFDGRGGTRGTRKARRFWRHWCVYRSTYRWRLNQQDKPGSARRPCRSD